MEASSPFATLCFVGIHYQQRTNLFLLWSFMVHAQVVTEVGLSLLPKLIFPLRRQTCRLCLNQDGIGFGHLHLQAILLFEVCIISRVINYCVTFGNPTPQNRRALQLVDILGNSLTLVSPTTPHYTAPRYHYFSLGLLSRSGLLV